MRAKVIALTMTLVPAPAFAEPIVWSGEIRLSGYDCKVAHRDGIVVRGAVLLIHPDDATPAGPIKEIGIRCPSLVFEAGSELQSISALDIRIDGTSSGDIRISNIRGYNGDDAPLTPEIWAPLKMRNGDNGVPGGNGNSARGCLGIDERRSSPGGHGQNGQPGTSGCYTLLRPVPTARTAALVAM